MREYAPRSPGIVTRFEEVMAAMTDRIESALVDLDVHDARGHAMLALATLDAHVHGVLTQTVDERMRERRIDLVVDQVVAVLGGRERPDLSR